MTKSGRVMDAAQSWLRPPTGGGVLNVGQRMHDRDVRAVLLGDLAAAHRDDADTLIIEELGLEQGARRVDVAVVNGVLAGYEIKSASDDLSRLRGQRTVYETIFDRLTLVAAARHLTKAVRCLPRWWGLLAAHERDNGLVLEQVRAAQDNPGSDVRAVVKLLWRDEALKVLADTVDISHLRQARRAVVWDALVATVPEDDLRSAVRTRLKTRSSWRVDRPLS